MLWQPGRIGHVRRAGRATRCGAAVKLRLRIGCVPGLAGSRGGMARFSKGDKVGWRSHGGEAVGKAKAKITSDTEAAGRVVRASEDDPQYLVESEKSGREAVHKPSALEKR